MNHTERHTRAALAHLMHAEALDWLLSCDWLDVDDYEIRDMSDLECLAAIECHYEGGILAFAKAMDI